MITNLYVGGLSYSTTNESLCSFFETAGQVSKASVVMDRDSGRSKGFGFVEMQNASDAQDAIARLNGQSLDGRTITVNEARERTPRRESSSRW